MNAAELPETDARSHQSSTQLVRWHGVVDTTALQQAAYRWVVDASVRAIAERGRFVIVLAGGNTPRGVYALLRDATTDWSRWDIWFGDERCAPPDDPERNSVMARDTWLAHVPIPQHRIYIIQAELGAEAAVIAYSDSLHGIGEFDLVLLGLGEDGHTASLFPDHDWGTAPDAPDVLAILDATKPPPQRVSMSAARLSRAREVLFLIDGDAKREAVTRWRARERIPARAIRPAAGVDALTERSLLIEHSILQDI
jgi:6-phosphogluconolactonase